MNLELLAFCLVGGLVYWDTDAVGQFGIAQPLIAASLAGSLLGNFTIGITIGILLQLPYLTELPAGGAKVSVTSLGSYLAAGLASRLSMSLPEASDLILVLSLAFAIFVGWALTPVQDGLRYLNGLLVKHVDRAAAAGNLRRITSLNYLSALFFFFFGVLSCGFFLWLTNDLSVLLAGLKPALLEAKLPFVKPVILGVGVGALLAHLLKKKEQVPFSLMGVALGGLILLAVLVN